MGVAVNIYLYPRYALVNMYAAYPAMTAVYVSVIFLTTQNPPNLR